MNLQFPISAQVAEPWPGLCLVAPKNETVPERRSLFRSRRRARKDEDHGSVILHPQGEDISTSVDERLKCIIN